MNVFFTGVERFSDSGVLVDLVSGPTLFFASNANVLADKDALEPIWNFKGSSGYNCCPLCDALMVGALADPSFPSDRASTCSEITCLRKDAFVASTNDSIFTLCDVLAQHNRQVPIQCFVCLVTI